MGDGVGNGVGDGVGGSGDESGSNLRKGGGGLGCLGRRRRESRGVGGGEGGGSIGTLERRGENGFRNLDLY